MTNYALLTSLAVCWTCQAQTPTMSPSQIQVSLLGDMRGDAALDMRSQSDNPHGFFVPDEFREFRSPARSAGVSISIGQLEHSVPNEALQAAARTQKLSRAGQHSKAIVEFEAAIRLDPEFASAQNALGIEYGRCGRLEDAAAAFKRVIQLAPEEFAGHYNLGLAMFQGGDLPGAFESVRRALQLAPAEPAVNLFLRQFATAYGAKKDAGVTIR